ncbi:uncharacterized protein K452DRAFT_126562 [Aplosporella prunicola CBS 121167]|uniref:Uncharacterized protein n=1 Tax=Aplosporella prunicola CBS 121167 TaxID=1176127 RepID=A0A6A6B1W1_9PEZI|nr:uncharacterized protein K452DRAFT_126562 [Aplosporella prunicola CBS 121167]KAF2136721.1 hypothetical protein K452DRAFT_126562 [Aplosporella prunicola CBS 121167]
MLVACETVAWVCLSSIFPFSLHLFCCLGAARCCLPASLLLPRFFAPHFTRLFFSTRTIRVSFHPRIHTHSIQRVNRLWGETFISFLHAVYNQLSNHQEKCSSQIMSPVLVVHHRQIPPPQIRKKE